RHVRDGHVDVVDDHGEVIGRIAVRAQQDEVVDQLAFEVDVAANEIVKLDRPRTDGEADHVRVVRVAGGLQAPAAARVSPLLAAVATGGEEIEDRRPRAADVKETGRGRSEAELHAGGECI